MEGLHYLLIGSGSLTDMERIIRQFADHPYTPPRRQEPQPRSWRAEERDYFLSLGGYFPEEEAGPPPASKTLFAGERLSIPDRDLYDEELFCESE